MTLMKSHKSRILVIGALPESLVNFRGSLIKSLVEQGFDVYAMAASASPETVQQIEALGATFRPYQITRTGLNPFSDFRTLADLFVALSSLKPTAVYCYTIKPVLYAGIASRFVPDRPNLVALVTGLGFAFSGISTKRKILRQVAIALYRVALAKATSVVFQNKHNLQYFVDNKIVSAKIACEVAGSGVALDHYRIQPMPDLPLRLLMASRLLREKGVIEFCEAAEIVKAKFPNVVFALAGPADPSPDSVDWEVVQSYIDKGIIVYKGNLVDVRPGLEWCHVFVLPSYHEGRARTIQEALATGRPVITTDAPGCYDAIDNETTGFIVKSRSTDALAKKILEIAKTPERILSMQQACRAYAEDRYDVIKINEFLISLINAPEV